MMNDQPFHLLTVLDPVELDLLATRSGPAPVWRRSFTMTEPDIYAPPAPIDTARTYPRTLVEAFPVSEGYRLSMFHPEDEKPIFKTKRRASIADRLSWSVSIAALIWLCWAVMNAPGK
jgi:hypothetical protein